MDERHLTEHGRLLVLARRHLWDMERQYGLKPWDTFLKHELGLARKEYRRLLKENKELSREANLRLF